MSIPLLKFFQPKDKIFHNLFERGADVSVKISEVLEAMKCTDAKRMEITAQTGRVRTQKPVISFIIFI
ncbi:MAG: hypothetical protein R2807_08930 [Chitinophagales bacterium]